MAISPKSQMHGNAGGRNGSREKFVQKHGSGHGGGMGQMQQPGAPSPSNRNQRVLMVSNNAAAAVAQENNSLTGPSSKVSSPKMHQQSADASSAGKQQLNFQLQVQSSAYG